jgi:hypothetical protein
MKRVARSHYESKARTFINSLSYFAHVWESDVELDDADPIHHLSRPANHPGIEPAAVRAKAFPLPGLGKRSIAKWVLASLKHALLIR